MRKPIIAGNWKMNNTAAEGVTLVNALKEKVKDANCDVVVCVPFTDIPAVGEAVKGTNIHLGAQNVHFAEKGAFTGEISAAMLKEFGVGASSSRKSLRMPQAPAQFRAMASLDRNRGARLWMWEGTEIRQALAAGGSKS